MENKAFKLKSIECEIQLEPEYKHSLSTEIKHFLVYVQSDHDSVRHLISDITLDSKASHISLLQDIEHNHSKEDVKRFQEWYLNTIAEREFYISEMKEKYKEEHTEKSNDDEWSYYE